MADTSILISNPDFQSNKDSLKQFMKGQSQFKDYNFDGANLNALIDLLAAAGYQQNFSRNMVASEMFMSTAQLPSSIFSRAKELGYTPRSARSAISTIQIEIVPGDEPSAITVPKGTPFSGTVGSKSLTFVTPTAYIIPRSPDGRYIGTLNIAEGLVTTDVYITDPSDGGFYQVTNRAVDVSSLTVSVIDNEGTTEYRRVVDASDNKSPNEPVFYVQINYQGYYEIYFGDNIIGKSPATGASVFLNYRICSADQGNGANLFRSSGSISGYNDVRILSSSLSQGGAQIENPEITRKFAAHANRIRDRAFTNDDYIIMLRQEFPDIQAINAFGGEELDPPRYGKIALSVTTSDNLMGVSDLTKARYTDYINRKNPTMITPMFIDPSIVSLKVNTLISYDYTTASVSESEIEGAARTRILKYNASELNNFNTTMYRSRLNSIITGLHNSIRGVSTEIEMVSAIDYLSLRDRGISITLHNEIAQCQTFLTPSVYSSAFKFENKTCRLVDNHDGILYIETTLNGVPSLIKSVGTVDYTTGSYNIQPFYISEMLAGALKMYAKPRAEDVNAVLNTIIYIDQTELQVKCKVAK